MKNHKQGFTLIEVVASLVIVGIALVAILRMFSFGSRSNISNQDRVIACNLLQRKVEEIKCKDFSTDVTESGISYTNFSDYTLNVSQITPYNANSYLKRVDVDVNWANPLGSQSETMSTLVADY